MNLYDIVGRRDRMLVVETGAAEKEEARDACGSFRAVRLLSGTRLRLRAAHEARVLATLPEDIGWTLRGAGKEARLRIWLEDGRDRQLLCKASIAEPGIRLKWPIPTPISYDLLLEAAGDVRIDCGPLATPKTRLLPLITGSGLEVGPGMQPTIVPGPSCDVHYIEKLPLDQWIATYLKSGPIPAAAKAYWSRYRVDSAHRLDHVADCSVDFIFSSHVIEHLVNPLGVLTNWWAKLRSGGVIAGVIPDARFTFDLRQPLTTLQELLEQERNGGFETTDAMYERWCKYTSPENNPDSLRRRQYSIHVNYFSPERFRDLLGLFEERQALAGLFMQAVRNGKDFGFLIQKP